MPNQIFMSYSRADTDFVIKLIKDLISQGLNIWLDQRNIGAGQRWDNTIQEALQSSDLFIIVLSPNSVASENVLDELSFAINSKIQIIPVLYRDCKIPYRIARIQFVDFRTDYERGFRHLISEIKQQPLQHPITTTKQRNAIRRPIWLGFAVVFIFGVIFCTGGYLIYSYFLQPADDTSTPNPTHSITQTQTETSPPTEMWTPTVTLQPTNTPRPTRTPLPTQLPTSTPVPPHAPLLENPSGGQLYEEHQQLIVLAAGEQHPWIVRDIWRGTTDVFPTCATGFMSLTWIVRDPYPTGGEDLQVLGAIPRGGEGRTELLASGSQGSLSLEWCAEIYFYNNSLQEYWVEIRYAGGIYP